ncbi:MAG: LysE family transporter [Gammaproteobacteria bacterium]|nr:LysE family transporter [Gammaproteobacteria bacterium]
MSDFAGQVSLFAAVAAAHLLAVISPGPDFALILRNTAAGGRRAGLWTAAGIGNGVLIHVGYGLFGLGLVAAALPWLLPILSWVGAAVLAMLGWQALRAQPAGAPRAAGTVRRHSYYLQGLATNTFNPKAVVFFVALFTAVIGGRAQLWLKLALALWLPLTTFAWFALLALLLGQLRLRARLALAAPLLARAMGLVMLSLAVMLAASAIAARGVAAG